MSEREQVYANQLKDGDRVEGIAVVERVETHGDDVVVHLVGTVRLKADEQVWRRA
jgi:hypothetical protein